ncbi:hypothetical protein D9757_006778 [Collybiopsis confluens]|uniref:Protein kinase domain-containing protein n=1 Tax=Collybiopsis confluens TaxID=2823264 RepID=A0A8H5M8U5_9AGAR|nr:hypothetical protein D9757_006778 [Collybiopsis confluens]
MLNSNFSDKDHASQMIELLQKEIDRAQTEKDIQRRAECLRVMRQLNRIHGVLPSSMFLQGLVCESQRPVTGGGFAGSDRDALLKSLSKEVLLWRQLQHPNILPFLGVDTTLFAPSFSIVSPWMDHGDLISYSRRCALDFGSKLNHMIQIAEGLVYLHELDPPVVHGDLKGANILISDDHSCCLADFGLSILETQSFNPTHTAAVQGSLRWLAPEYISPSNRPTVVSLTPRDIYALGCTVFELLTEQPPFAHHRQDISVAIDVLNGIRPIVPADIFSNEIMFESIRQVLSWCWLEETTKRPSARNVLDCLKDVGSISRTGSENLFPLLPSVGGESALAADTPSQCPDAIKIPRTPIPDEIKPISNAQIMKKEIPDTGSSASSTTAYDEKKDVDVPDARVDFSDKETAKTEESSVNFASAFLLPALPTVDSDTQNLGFRSPQLSRLLSATIHGAKHTPANSAGTQASSSSGSFSKPETKQSKVEGKGNAEAKALLREQIKLLESTLEKLDSESSPVEPSASSLTQVKQSEGKGKAPILANSKRNQRKRQNTEYLYLQFFSVGTKESRLWETLPAKTQAKMAREFPPESSQAWDKVKLLVPQVRSGNRRHDEPVTKGSGGNRASPKSSQSLMLKSPPLGTSAEASYSGLEPRDSSHSIQDVDEKDPGTSPAEEASSSSESEYHSIHSSPSASVAPEDAVYRPRSRAGTIAEGYTSSLQSLASSVLTASSIAVSDREGDLHDGSSANDAFVRSSSPLPCSLEIERDSYNASADEAYGDEEWTVTKTETKNGISHEMSPIEGFRPRGRVNLSLYTSNRRPFGLATFSSGPDQTPSPLSPIDFNGEVREEQEQITVLSQDFEDETDETRPSVRVKTLESAVSQGKLMPVSMSAMNQPYSVIEADVLEGGLQWDDPALYHAWEMYNRRHNSTRP